MRNLTTLALLILTLGSCSPAENHWVTTWATAIQLAEDRNNPPEPYLAGNSLRQIVQVSIPGKGLRLHLSNFFNVDGTEILGVEIAEAKTMGESPDIYPESRMELTFGGKRSFTMGAGEAVVSDPVRFKVTERMNLAITIHYGETSSTCVTSHPGSRTTSYLAKGNTDNFTTEVTETAHWYTIAAIDVVNRKGTAIGVIGDSITDGRGSTTNKQDRWTDELSRALLADRRTSHISVLNLGLGGNCIVRGGLGPVANDRYARDLFRHSGLKYVILFEGTNDLGTSDDGVETAKEIIASWQKIADDCHGRGIKVFGATIMPVKGNGYFREDREEGRTMVNEWIRHGGVFDGVIDFDKMTCDPSDPQRLNPAFLYENDWLHGNAACYRLMGRSIDLGLFR